VFIGHLPAAYLFGRTASKYLYANSSMSRYTVLAAMTGGILPDVDLVYFYTIGARQTVHHAYWSHIPIYWLISYVVLASIALLLRRIGAFKLLSVFFPLSTKAYTLVHVPAVHGWWVANFLLHWTFAIELFITSLAVIFYIKYR